MARGLFRLLLYLVIFYLVYLVLRIFRAAVRPPRRPQTPQVRGAMVKDEICDTYIPKDTALREFHEGEEHFFCSEDCRRKYHEKLRAR